MNILNIFFGCCKTNISYIIFRRFAVNCLSLSLLFFFLSPSLFFFLMVKCLDIFSMSGSKYPRHFVVRLMAYYFDIFLGV